MKPSRRSDHRVMTAGARARRGLAVASCVAAAALFVVYVVRGLIIVEWRWWDVLLGVILGHLAVDAAVFVVHWAMDNYFAVHTPIIGQTIAFFREHHETPERLLERDFVDGNFENALAAVGVALTLLPFEIGATGSLFIAVVCLEGGCATQIHKWLHTPRAPAPIRVLQRLRILIPTDAHAVHHRALNCRYGLVSGWVDPLFESLGVLNGMEAAIYVATAQTACQTRLGLSPSEGRMTLASRWRRVKGLPLAPIGKAGIHSAPPLRCPPSRA